jgi:hypothetical protein
MRMITERGLRVKAGFVTENTGGGLRNADVLERQSQMRIEASIDEAKGRDYTSVRRCV